MVTRAAAVGMNRYLNCRTVAESAAALPDTRETQGSSRTTTHQPTCRCKHGEAAQDGGHPPSAAIMDFAWWTGGVLWLGQARSAGARRPWLARMTSVSELICWMVGTRSMCLCDDHSKRTALPRSLWLQTRARTAHRPYTSVRLRHVILMGGTDVTVPVDTERPRYDSLVVVGGASL